MYIYQITIEGFKSYKDRTVIGPFHPKHNAVVGRNGSGKSNFFFAIQFVLSNEFTQLRAEQRQALLYEGSGPRLISASVELIFENSDRRLGIDKDKVSLKRTIGLKSDQYFLNKKIITRDDVINLLESAGFSSSNPYYIVKQGKINEMTLSSESRLKLLTEITGAKVYEDKKQESLLLFKNAQVVCNKIKQHFKTIDERLAILKEETQELEEYQKWDKQHRSIEFIIHERILIENKEELQKLENFRMEWNKIQSGIVNELEIVRKNIKEANKELKQTKRMIENAKTQENIIRADKEELVKEEIKLKSLINDLTEESEKNSNKCEHIKHELGILHTQIDENNENLQSIKSQFDQILHKEEELSMELDLQEQKQKELYKKQGRGIQFKDKNERNAWIKNELKQLKEQIEEKNELQNNVETELKKDEIYHSTLEKKIEESILEMDRLKNLIENVNQEYYDLHKQKNESIIRRKTLYQPEILYQHELTTKKNNLEKIDRNLKFIFGKQITDGKSSILQVLNRFSENTAMAPEIRKYYGLIIDIFQCDPKIYKAVEVTAGNRLFHHVVKTSDFANEILKEMNNRRYPGEVTFMPLDCLKVQNFYYPEIKNAKPLIALMEYENKYDKPLRKIFGKTLLCKDLATAEICSREYNLDCITLEGDQAFCKGSLKGGHFYNSKSPMQIQNERLEALRLIRYAQEDFDEIKSEINKIDCDITSYMSIMQRLETKISNLSDSYNKIKFEVCIMKKELSELNEQKTLKKKSLQDHKLSIEAMHASKESLENELVQDLIKQLPVTDLNYIQNLNDSIIRLKKELKEIFQARAELEIQKNKIENLLTNNLIKKKEQLEQELEETCKENKQQVEMFITQLLKVQNDILKCKDGYDIQKIEITNATEKQNLINLEVDKWSEIENDNLKKIDEGAKKLERLLNKELNIKQNIMQSSDCISALGTIPNSETYLKFSQMKTKHLYRLLEEAKRHLKKYTHIHKEILNKYNTFQDQRKLLFNNKTEIDRVHEKIQELMDVLQHKKCEAIEFTFQQVRKYFSELFTKLVPKGHAQLVLKTSNRQDDTENVSEASIHSDNFVGIDIMVSFTENTEETREIHQLSGGQKSLVALTLIFAIQKCDPAPFYLFDEIDQALDTEHREAVAEMISELSSGAQFITTTFRPESLQHANSYFGVIFQNNISYVQCISREEAIQFLEKQNR